MKSGQYGDLHRLRLINLFLFILSPIIFSPGFGYHPRVPPFLCQNPCSLHFLTSLAAFFLSVSMRVKSWAKFHAMMQILEQLFLHAHLE